MKKTSYCLMGILIIFFDRFTKNWALQQCEFPYVINNFITCEVGYNRGVTWGLLHSTSPWLFGIVTAFIIFITLIVIRYAQNQYAQGYSIFGETLVVAGSLSNIVDRFLYGGVVDFIELSYGNWVWPSFNIADASIVCGVFMMLFVHYKKGT